LYAQGGAGKTTLLREFEAICQEEEVPYVYIDAKRESGDRITDLVDLMRSIRSHFSQTRFQAIFRLSPFADFDDVFRRYKGLEEKVQQKREQDAVFEESSTVSKVVGSLASEGMKFIPGSDVVTAVVGEDTIQESAQGIFRFTAKTVREWLSDAFGNLDDADFFQDPEPLLIEKFSEALDEWLGDKVFVLLLDSYEEFNRFDTARYYDKMIEYSFILQVGSGFAVHDLVRDYTLYTLKHRHPSIYQELHTNGTGFCHQANGLHIAFILDITS